MSKQAQAREAAKAEEIARLGPEAAKLAKEIEAARKAQRERGPTLWAFGRATQRGFEILAVGYDHNTLEARSKRVNKEAGSRVAFIVDAAHIPPAVAARFEQNA